MILSSVPYAARANDAHAGIKMALALTAIESCLTRPLRAPAFQHLRIARLPRALHTAGLALHLPIAPHIETHMQLEVKQPSPRNPKSMIPPAKQLEIFNAAEAKRARKEAQRMLDAGGSVEDSL